VSFPSLAFPLPFISVSKIIHCNSSRPLENGDIINIDITVFLDGYHGDTSKTFLVGNVVRTLTSLFKNINAEDIM